MSDTFTTESLEAACYLVAMGADPPKVRAGRKPGLVEFTFDDPDGSAEWTAQEVTIKDLDDNEVAMVPARKLFSAMKTVRRLMNEAKAYQPPRHK